MGTAKSSEAGWVGPAEEEKKPHTAAIRVRVAELVQVIREHAFEDLLVVVAAVRLVGLTGPLGQDAVFAELRGGQ